MLTSSSEGRSIADGCVVRRIYLVITKSKIKTVTDWLTECLYYDIWQTADEITVDVYINVKVCIYRVTQRFGYFPNHCISDRWWNVAVWEIRDHLFPYPESSTPSLTLMHLRRHHIRYCPSASSVSVSLLDRHAPFSSGVASYRALGHVPPRLITKRERKLYSPQHE